MKSIRNIAFSALLTLGAFSAVTYTACNKDACKDVVCNNGGTCVDGSCQCAAGFEGVTCDVQSRSRFLTSGTVATWVVGLGQDGCYNPGYNMTIGPGANADEITITNFAGYGATAIVTGVKVNGMAFSKTGTVTAGAVTLSNISGTINSASNEITFSYTAADANGPINCNAKATKQ